jgi:GT2 family glycosyltransferase
MNKPALSILIPHLSQPENDKALKICLECLVDNTDINYEIVIDTTVGDVYTILNDMAKRASSDWITFLNSDVFVAPGWASQLIAAANPTKIITGVIVEPGAIGVSTMNHCRDFGMTPDTFQREAFERWCVNSFEIPDGEGWYFPSLHNRQAFLDFGGFNTTLGAFPDQLDVDYWNRWRSAGYTVERVKSFCYHLQNYSNPAEQAKAVRHV